MIYNNPCEEHAMDEESDLSISCVSTLLSPFITYRTNNISCSIEELYVEPSDMMDIKDDLLLSL